MKKSAPTLRVLPGSLPGATPLNRALHADSHRLRALSAITAAAAAVVLFGLPYRLNILAAIPVAVAISLYAEPRPPAAGDDAGARDA